MTEEKKYDFILFGASGFTGKAILSYIKLKCPAYLKYAIAGRSYEKLKNDSNEVVDIIVADIHDDLSLKHCTLQTKLLLNCTGPYRFYGEKIVKACLETNTHYMDICGEPKFIEDMFLKYNATAKDKGIQIIHACAFDSVPADLGALFVTRLFDKNECNSIESFLQISSKNGFCLHATTYECAIHGMSDINELKKIRREIDKIAPSVSYNTSNVKKREGLFYVPHFHQYAYPFLGADASIVRLSQRCLQNEIMKWPRYSAYINVNHWKYIPLLFLFGTMISFLNSFSWGKKLLLKYPSFFTFGLFSHKGPTDEQKKSTSFSMNFFAIGKLNNQDKKVKVSISGPEPGYVSTPIIFMTLVFAFLGNKCNRSGGVQTPAIAFYHQKDIFKKLEEAGIQFHIYD